MDDLYQEAILEHYREPQNYGVMDGADFVIEEANASCGDSFTFYVKLSEDKQVIGQVMFIGQGCAISTAACSILTEALVGKPALLVKDYSPEKMQELLGIEVTALRLKCLMLPQRAVEKVMNSKEHMHV